LEADRTFSHVPVLLKEVLFWLEPALRDGGVLVDCTLGAGGHSEALLRAYSNVKLVGIDRDQRALEAAGGRLEPFSGRTRLVHGNYSRLTELLAPNDVPVKGVLYDLGVSSPQLDDAERGFQYRGEHPLDMRMDSSLPKTAAGIVNTYSEDALARILRQYGEERFSRRVARAIVDRRKKSPFRTGGDLAEVVKNAIPAATRRRGPHPARRTFQALRIEVNNELGSLEESLPQAIDVLSPQGRAAAISYHSGEDRIVKKTFADAARGCTCPSDLPVCVCGRDAVVSVLTKKPIRPTEEEVRENPRADSARMRVAKKHGPSGDGEVA
jgi:16S rRNA (cytosine1402-N4)-methyltransferase